MLGLLIAFSFAGSYERFESRKVLIIQEANAIFTAYLRLDLLPQPAANILRHEFQDYMKVRLGIYKDLTITNFKIIDDRAADSRQIQLKIWNEAVTSLKTAQDSSATELVLPALNTMFETSNAQFAMSKVHPPLAIFALLLGLALLSAFLTGYSNARKKIKNYTYIFSYIAVMTVTLYVIFDIELPRIGLIRVTGFEKNIMDKLTDLTKNYDTAITKI